MKEPQAVLHIQSMRGKPQYRHLSNEMLRVLDLGASKGQQAQSYEYKAMTEFHQNPG